MDVFRPVLTWDNLKEVLSRVVRIQRQLGNFAVTDVDDRLETKRQKKKKKLQREKNTDRKEPLQKGEVCSVNMMTVSLHAVSKRGFSQSYQRDRCQWVELAGRPTGLCLWTPS